MQITDEWLTSISDDKGLTHGQRSLLAIWARRQGPDQAGQLPDQVAHFIAQCRGYRNGRYETTLQPVF